MKASRKPIEPAQPRPAIPTPEQLAKGGYTRPDTRGAFAVYTNCHADQLGRYRSFGVITKRQHDAGRAFEATWVYVNGSPSPARDSTVHSIGGTIHETEAQAERVCRARARLRTVLERIGPASYSQLVDIACFGGRIPANRGAGKSKALRLRQMLVDALEQCAVVYGIDDT